jgi:hypothetical protein
VARSSYIYAFVFAGQLFEKGSDEPMHPVTTIFGLFTVKREAIDCAIKMGWYSEKGLELYRFADNILRHKKMPQNTIVDGWREEAFALDPKNQPDMFSKGN